MLQSQNSASCPLWCSHPVLSPPAMHLDSADQSFFSCNCRWAINTFRNIASAPLTIRHRPCPSHVGSAIGNPPPETKNKTSTENRRSRQYPSPIICILYISLIGSLMFIGIKRTWSRQPPDGFDIPFGSNLVQKRPGSPSDLQRIDIDQCALPPQSREITGPTTWLELLGVSKLDHSSLLVVIMII